MPRDAAPPPPEYSDLVTKHLVWAQNRYRDLLSGQDTFQIAAGTPLVLSGQKDIAQYQASNDGGAEASLQELFLHDRVDRNSCRFIYIVLFVGTGPWPGGGGRPINGGLNTGGGIIILSADLLAKPNFQSTLRHELGHAFGLPHVDVYGYDMSTNPSLMSYNPVHHTRGFEDSPTPGVLIPEDLRALSRAKRIFPNFTINPARDYPPGYTQAPLVMLGPMQIGGQAEYGGPQIVE
ncbi:MAG: hypothetical protein KKB50_11985 [Planctomycetes bacterium]|nr:hypothetical protein [Planctomycetota bacterium]